MIINIIANTAQGPSLSGGDRIFIENARRWVRMGDKVNIFVWEEGYEMCRRCHLENVHFHLIKILKYKRLGFFLGYLLRIIKGSFRVLQFRFDEGQRNVIYSASDFLPDVIPAFLMRLKNRKAKWVASLLLIIKSPTIFSNLLGNSQINFKVKIKNPFYYISQKTSLFLIKLKADALWVLNREDKEYLQKTGINGEKIRVINGGIDLQFFRSIQSSSERYDACFLGRLHPQKGVTDLAKIWEIVCQQRPGARLAIIGAGTDEIIRLLKRQIADLHLEQNITLFGLVEHTRQFSIMKSANVFLLPSYYESWGLVACEALACHLPIVAYDLSLSRDIFPKGMITVPKGNIRKFAESVIFLLNSKSIANKIAAQGADLVKKYDWDVVSRKNHSFLQELFA